MEQVRDKVKDIKLIISPPDTDAIKGIALMLLLFHHLFYIQNGNYDDIYIKGYGVIQALALVCKVCVPLFVFLSGYGLAASSEKLERISITDFYKKRFVKLYSNYWIMWLLFVPIGIVTFGMTFETVYGDYWKPKLMLDFFGLLNCFKLYGYNPTWWFYSCIILLYLLFPFIISLCQHKKKYWLTHLMFWCAVIFAFLPIPLIHPIRFYMLTFILGILFRNGLIFNLIPPPLSICRIGRLMDCSQDLKHLCLQ